MNRAKIEELPIYGEYDAIVSGGGLIGVTCAVALGRSGKRVALVERRSTLGWELVRARRILGWPPAENPISSTYAADIAKAQSLGSRQGMGFNAPAVELELDRWVLEANVDVMFHGWPQKVTESGEQVDGLVVGTKEGYVRLLAPLVVETDDSGRLIDSSIPRLAVSRPIWRSCLLHDAVLSGNRVLEHDNGRHISLRPLSEDHCRVDIPLKGEDLQSRDLEFHAALLEALPLIRGEYGCESAKLYYLAEEEWAQPSFRLSAEAKTEGEPVIGQRMQGSFPSGRVLSQAPQRLTSRHMVASHIKGLVLGGPWLPSYLDISADSEEAGMVNRVLLGESIAAFAGCMVMSKA
ncbi:FAD-dependent oxidoreductase [Paenibacillus mesophilus]|uniref:FAD-dependent oxidoreductase n=1 Tax=Paenibacillus mesophilus TaxID=2582849 RepID=UPI00110F0583|nr:FAD-dependent oxidoreductase [Paenibacillus mesophilus]TMV48599.1 FAD-dependent oxidoreductase [Paenibacillus mesophilus]